MSSDVANERRVAAAGAGRGALGLAGLLLVGGLVLNAVATLIHPAGDEDDHEAIFRQYADSGAWVAVHLAQFVGVLLALGGLLALYRAMRAGGHAALLADLAAVLTGATAATWAVLQGLDGVGLKQAVEAWDRASGAEESIRFANAETVRWLEWGFQSYFRVLLGLTLVLFGAAILASRVVAGWLGWAAICAGVCALVIGIDVGYNGLASGLQDALSIAFLVVVLVFACGILAAGIRHGGRPAAART